jgi:hypothetical protein
MKAGASLAPDFRLAGLHLCDNNERNPDFIMIRVAVVCSPEARA